MRFVLDAQLPRAALEPFRAAGHQALHVAEIASARSSDIEIWRLAAKLEAVIVTKDEDFVGLQATQSAAVAIVWLRCGNIYNPILVRLLADRLGAVVTAIESGARLIELH